MTMFMKNNCQARGTADKLADGFVDGSSAVKLARPILRLKHSKLTKLTINFEFDKSSFVVVSFLVC